MPEPGRTAFSALRSSSHPIGDLVLAAAARLAASIILFLFGGLIVSLLAESWPVIHAFGADFYGVIAGIRLLMLSAHWRRFTAPSLPPSLLYGLQRPSVLASHFSCLNSL